MMCKMQYSLSCQQTEFLNALDSLKTATGKTMTFKEHYMAFAVVTDHHKSHAFSTTV